MKSINYHRKKHERQLRLKVDALVQAAMDSAKSPEEIEFRKWESAIYPLWMVTEAQRAKRK